MASETCTSRSALALLAVCVLGCAPRVAAVAAAVDDAGDVRDTGGNVSQASAPEDTESQPDILGAITGETFNGDTWYGNETACMKVQQLAVITGVPWSDVQPQTPNSIGMMTSDGVVWEWGVYANFSTNKMETIPVHQINHMPSAIAMTNLFGHCTLGVDHLVRCWGNYLMIKPSKNEVDSPVDATVVDGLPVNPIGLGEAESYTCVIGGLKQVACWGEFLPEEPAAGNAPYHSWERKPHIMPSLAGLDKIAVGALQVCGLLAGTPRCRLPEHYYNGKIPGKTYDVPSIPDAMAVAAGGLHACAIRADGSVWCWGAGYAGQLGNGKLQDSDAPVHVTPLPPVVEISSYRQTTCARTMAGDVYCWGSSSSIAPALPYGSTPVKIDIAGVQQLHVGYEAVCANHCDGRLWCWGQDFTYVAADGSMATAPKPHPIDLP